MTRVSTLPAAAADAAALHPSTRYTTVAITLHWVIAALMIGQVALGLRMAAAHGTARFAIFQLHKSIGITILILVVLRLAWRMYRTPPAMNAHGWQRVLAGGVHGLFYLLLFALPLSGWLIISTSRIIVPTLLYGMIPWPHFPATGALDTAARTMWNTAAKFAHVNLVTVLYALFALHLAGALKHHWLDRDATLARMAPGVQAGRWADPRLVIIGLGVVLAASLGLWAPIGSTRVAVSVATNPAPPPVLPAQPVPAPVADTPAPIVPAVPMQAPAEAAAAVPTTVSSWAIQPGSTLHWRTIWSGETINGGFNRFDGDIVFDPEALDRSHVALTIDTASVFSGDAQRDETLKSADWFATETSPAATFTADRFRRTAPGHFVAAGKLRLKGVTLAVPVAFTLTIAGDIATMRGTATVDRTAFKIGEGEFAATTELPAAVALDIAVAAKRK